MRTLRSKPNSLLDVSMPCLTFIGQALRTFLSMPYNGFPSAHMGRPNVLRSHCNTENAGALQVFVLQLQTSYRTTSAALQISEANGKKCISKSLIIYFTADFSGVPSVLSFVSVKHAYRLRFCFLSGTVVTFTRQKL